MGITSKEVIGYLIKQILALGSKTRLFADCHPAVTDNWEYDYRVIEKESDIGITVAKETISYKNQTVFVHYFFLCPVR